MPAGPDISDFTESRDLKALARERTLQLQLVTVRPPTVSTIEPRFSTRFKQKPGRCFMGTRDPCEMEAMRNFGSRDLVIAIVHETMETVRSSVTTSPTGFWEGLLTEKRKGMLAGLNYAVHPH